MILRLIKVVKVYTFAVYNLHVKLVEFHKIYDKAKKKAQPAKRFKPLEDSFGEKDRFSALCAELGTT